MTNPDPRLHSDKREQDIDLLRVNAAEFGRRADVRQKLEMMLAERLGVSARHERSVMVVPPRSNLHAYIRTGRTHTKHTFRLLGRCDERYSSFTRDGRVELFIKAGAKVRLSSLDEALNRMVGKGVRQPFYWGALFLDDGTQLGVWEFVEGVRTPFEELPASSQLRLVQAVATFNATPVNGLQTLTKWVTSPLSWYAGRFQRFSDEDRAKWGGAMDRLAHVLGRDNIVKNVIGGYGQTLLAHNDINPNNVFAPSEGDVIVFDWEGATRSVPGADLRFLVRMEQRDLLLNAYIARMAECGIILERADVRRAFEIVEGFRRIYKGWAGRNLSSVLSGLAMAEEYISPSTGGPTTRGASAKPITIPEQARRERSRNPSERSDRGASRTMANNGTLATAGGSREEHRTPSRELTDRIEEYVMTKGHLYAPLVHPAFSELPTKWGPDRFDIFASHLECPGGTALDIGSHWGYMAQRLEDMGYKVTACEHSPKHVYFLRELRALSHYKFDVVAGDIFDMKAPKFDVMIALNIFHHFLKTEERFGKFTSFLDRSDCGMMIYQAHRSAEKPKLDMAGHYMEPKEMARYIADHLRLPRVEHIGVHGKRDIFKLAR